MVPVPFSLPVCVDVSRLHFFPNEQLNVFFEDTSMKLAYWTIVICATVSGGFCCGPGRGDGVAGL